LRVKFKIEHYIRFSFTFGIAPTPLYGGVGNTSIKSYAYSSSKTQHDQFQYRPS
jgi:hypothetical protein